VDSHGVAHKRPDVALQHDAFNPIPGVRVPFYRVGLRGLAFDVSLVSSVSVDADVSALRPRPEAPARGEDGEARALVFAPALGVRAPRGLHVRRAARRLPPPSGAPRGADGAGNRGSMGRCGRRRQCGRVMGASPLQMRGAVLGHLKADFFPSSR